MPLCAFGSFRYRLWEQWPSGRFGELLILSLPAWGLSWPVRRFAGGSWATALALLWCLALVFFAGVLPVAATLALAATALAVAGMLAARESPALQAACGLALLGGALGWLLPLPAHFGWSYLCLGFALVLLRRRQLAASLRDLRDGWRDSAAAAPRASAWAVLALGLASTGCWLPPWENEP